MAISGTGLSNGGWFAPVNLTAPSDFPISVSGWFRMPAITADTTFFALSGSDTGANTIATMAGVYFQGNLYNDAYDDTAASEGGEWGAWTPQPGWHHLCVQWLANSTWLVWFDGQSIGTSNFVGTYGAATFTQLRVGYAPANSGEPPFTAGAATAEISVWKGTLLSSEIRELAQGENPLNLNGGRLRAYYPLINSLAGKAPGNLIGMQPSGAIADPIWTDHPKIVRARAKNLSVFATRSGSVAATQGSQTISATAEPRVGGTLSIQTTQSLSAAARSPVTGQLSTTATQFLSAVARIPVTGTVSAASAAQTLSAAGSGPTVLAGLGGLNPFSSEFSAEFGSGLVSQADQVLSAATFSGSFLTLTETQSTQTLSANSRILVSGSAVKAQPDNTSFLSVASLSSAQAAQTIFGTASPSAGGTLVETQPSQTVASNAKLLITAGNGGVQAGQVLVGAAAVRVSGSASVSQDAETISASVGATLPQGTLSIVQSQNALLSNGIVSVSAAVVATQSANSPSAAAITQISGSISLVEGPQTVASAAGAVVGGALAASQQVQTLSAASGQPVQATVSRSQADNTLIARSDASVSASFSSVAASQSISAAVILSVVGSLSSTQSHTLSSTGNLPIIDGLAIVQAPQALSGAASLPVSGGLIKAEADQVLSSVSTPNITGTLSISSSAVSQALFARGAPIVYAGLGGLSPFSSDFSTDFGAGLVAQDDQGLAAQGGPTASARLAVGQGSQGITAQAGPIAQGRLATVLVSDGGQASAGVLSGGTLSVGQAGQIGAVVALSTVGAITTVTEASQTLSAPAIVYWGATVVVTQTDQSVLAQGEPVIGGSISHPEDGEGGFAHGLVGNAAVDTGGHIVLTQDSQRIFASIKLPVFGIDYENQVYPVPMKRTVFVPPV